MFLSLSGISKRRKVLNCDGGGAVSDGVGSPNQMDFPKDQENMSKQMDTDEWFGDNELPNDRI